MNYRALTVSAVIATAVAGIAPIGRADIVASDQGIAVRDAGVAAPARGMSMSQVATKFGDPVSKVPAVGTPPISRWEYSSFVVYFERDHVIHAVVSGAGPTTDPVGAPAPPPAAAAEPAPEASAPPEPTLAATPPPPPPAAAPSAAPMEAPPPPPPAAPAAASAADDSEAPAQP